MDEYDDGATYYDTDGSGNAENDLIRSDNSSDDRSDVSLEKKKMNGCGHDVNQTVEGSGVNLQVRNGSEGANKTERVNDVNVQDNEGEHDEHADKDAKSDVSERSCSIPA